MNCLSKSILLLCLASVSGLSFPVVAQDHLFGSVDDPAELPRPAWWMRSSYVEPLGGFSLIGAQWRTGARFRGHFETRTTMVELDGSFRAGIYGKYDPDTDEAYDLARALRFARLNTTNAYVRVGTPDRTRMGPGLVTDFYQGAAVWDDRRIGLEVALRNRFLTISGVAADLRMNRMISARVELSPTGAMSTPGGLRIGLGLTTDRRFSADGPEVPTAREVDIRITAARSGGFRLEPFLSAAQYIRYGRGLMLGADLQTDNFIDLARVHARLALQYAEDRFIPGYFGSFYEVNNPGAGVISSETLGGSPAVSLSEASAATYLLTEFRLLFFESFEFRYAFRRHFGPQTLSTFHVRLFLRTEDILFSFSEDRAGLRSFFSLFNDVGDMAVMSFRAEYRITGPVWLAVDARYGYEAILVTDGVTRYAAQRRFEPFLGLRLQL